MVLLPLIFTMFLFGVFPNIILTDLHYSVSSLLTSSPFSRDNLYDTVVRVAEIRITHIPTIPDLFNLGSAIIVVCGLGGLLFFIWQIIQCTYLLLFLGFILKLAFTY